MNDCGKVQVTGEVVQPKYYRINVTFISERDPIRNAKVDATSTVYAVVQIGLRGGIFQYTNALKILGKPSQILNFDEAFFCYRGSTLTDQDNCSKDDFSSNSRAATPPSTHAKSQNVKTSVTTTPLATLPISFIPTTTTAPIISSTIDSKNDNDPIKEQ
ncbi:unnamed protein product [Cercopithifilaria johnstoni]|uniref:Uncharacterized protein n=1 Tax=Cercopithifilaria johnstoni TaxID=2874296 RepID=A0A8J2MJP0_9BILA|nr:unnamed protein product [Cercopithifilaria johnstoni]